jgi:hypothetical protein
MRFEFLLLPALGAIAQNDPPPILTADNVRSVVQNAAASVNVPMVIAVTDRQGNILAVFQKPGASSTALANFGVPADSNEVAVALARTASFFSNSQAPLSSRTVRFISGTHFPPGIAFTANGPLTVSKIPTAAAHLTRLLFRAGRYRPHDQSTPRNLDLESSPAKPMSTIATRTL